MIVSYQTLHSQSHEEFGMAIHFEIISSVHSDWSGCIAEGRSLKITNMTLNFDIKFNWVCDLSPSAVRTPQSMTTLCH